MDSAERSAETAPLPVATAAARVNEARAGSCLAPRQCPCTWRIAGSFAAGVPGAADAAAGLSGR